jgi:hypothetical protein
MYKVIFFRLNIIQLIVLLVKLRYQAIYPTREVAKSCS